MVCRCVYRVYRNKDLTKRLGVLQNGLFVLLEAEINNRTKKKTSIDKPVFFNQSLVLNSNIIKPFHLKIEMCCCASEKHHKES